MKRGTLLLICLNATPTFAFLFCISQLLPQNLSAEDSPDNATRMLDNLKRRSAEERWQRIKRLHPTESSSAHRNFPPAVSNEAPPASGEEGVPPAPEEGPLIPRLPVLPMNASNDWLMPSKPIPIEEGVTLPAPEDPLPPAPSKSENRSSHSAPRIAAQPLDEQLPSPSPLEEDMAVRAPRNAFIRKIGDISPYYDRERDTDIREFAEEKSREYEGMVERRPFEPRMFPEVNMTWDPSNLYYYPLYFQDTALERYGHSYHPWLQPWVSIARFSAQFLMLPYQITIEPICAPVSPLGWYRPGDVTPKLLYQVPLNAEAAAVEAGVVTGFYFIIVQ